MFRRPVLVTLAICLAAGLGLAGWAWLALPGDRPIPIHWGADGRPNGFGTRTEAVLSLLIMPGAVLLIGVILLVVPAIDPRGSNLRLTPRAYTGLSIAVLAGMTLIGAAITLATLGRTVGDLSPMGPLGIAMGILFAGLGWFMPGLRSNFFAGIRTPWTLSSERAWTTTHRVGGRLFLVFGVLMAVTAVLSPGAFVWVTLAGVAVILVVTTAVSFAVWRRDPDRHRPAGADPAAGV